MFANELGFAAQRFEIPVGSNSEVSILLYKQAQLVGEIDVVLVVRSGGEENDLAFILLNVFVNGAVALTFAVSEVVTFIDHHKAIAPEAWQLLIGYPAQ